MYNLGFADDIDLIDESKENLEELKRLARADFVTIGSLVCLHFID